MLKYLNKSIDSMQKIGKMKDSIPIGLLGGLIGTIAMEVTNGLIFMGKNTEITYGQIAAQLLVSPARAKQRKNFILGEIIHLSAGSLVGVPLFYILKKTGKDNYLIKGLGVSAFIYSVLYAGGQKFGLFNKLRLTKTHYSAIFNHLIYGLTSAKALVMLADPSVFTSSKEINKGISMQVEKDANYPNSFRSSNGITQSQSHHVVH